MIRSRTWTLLDDPSSSKAARAVSVATLALILISSLAFCLETMPQLTASADARLAFHAIESMCVGLFTLEYFLRLAACPNTRAFLTSPMNAVDLVAIAPFYLALFVDNSGGAGGARMLRTLRLVRVTRLFKLGGRVARLRVVASSMRESADMLAMMVFLLAVAVLVFATLVFYVERGEYVPEDPVDGSGGFYSRRSDASCSAERLECFRFEFRNELRMRAARDAVQVHPGLLLVDRRDVDDRGVRRRDPDDGCR